MTRPPSFGWRLRIGMILPSVNSVAEGEVSAMLPPGVSLHTTRLKLAGGSPEELICMADHVEEAALLLADANVDVIVFHCTAVTTFDARLERRIRERIMSATNRSAITTAESVIGALNALHARRIVLVTPYSQEINARERLFLADAGIQTVQDIGLGLDSPEAFAGKDPGGWYRVAKSMRHADADAYFLSCTAIRTAPVVQLLEEDLGVPVITSNQAMTWYALRSCHVNETVENFGRLLRQPSAPLQVDEISPEAPR